MQINPTAAVGSGLGLAATAAGGALAYGVAKRGIKKAFGGRRKRKRTKRKLAKA